MIKTECQAEILIDKRKNGKSRPWAVHKVSNTYLAIAYDEIDENKASRLRDCASWLEFNRTDEGGLKLHKANFCRVRLCPICSWRRSLKTYGQVRKIINVTGNNYAYIFMTLTVKNCTPEELDSELTAITKAWNRFIGYKAVKNVIKGYYRATEVTHNIENDTFHPHFHCLFAVNKSYFSGKTYLNYEKWRELWKKALRVDYEPQINIQRVKGQNVEGVCAEVAKYATKVDEDVLCFDDWDLTVQTVDVLNTAFNKRRFIAFGGIFKEIHKQLNLDDIEDGDLTHIEDEPNGDLTQDKLLYAWNSGYNQYIKV